MPRTPSLVATLLTLSTVWGAEPVRPLEWKPIVPLAPAAATAGPASRTPPAPTTASTYAPTAVADANQFTPFNGLILEPRVISTVNGTTTVGLGWDLDLSLLHNRVAALVRGLSESTASRTVAKDQLDLDIQVEGFGQIAADPDDNPADHQSSRLSAVLGYGFVGVPGSANHFSDDASSLYLDAAAQLGLENSQNLRSTQSVIGVRITATPSLSADAADWNVFDWIPRIGRFLSGDTWTDSGSGRAMPILTLGLDHIAAGGNDQRDRIAPGDSSYVRVHLGVTGRAPIWRLPGSDQYLYGLFAADLYQEMSAPTAISNADLDSTSRIRLGLELPHDLILAVNRGDLPMDPGTRTFWTVGWKLVL